LLKKTNCLALKEICMKNKFVLIILLFCLTYKTCVSQINKAENEKFVIVLDIQEFYKKNSQLDSSVREMVLNVNSLISNFEPKKIIYVKAAGKMLYISLKGFLVDTMEAPKFDSNLNILSNNIFIKVEGDAFTCGELVNFLKANNAKEIVLVGLMAEKCLYQTAMGGIARGYNIYIVPEAIVGMTQKKKVKAIKKMNKNGVKSLTIKEIIGTL